MPKTQIVIFTDLDGTLLEHDSYSFDPASEALDLIRRNKIPLIICTSKTRKEIEAYIKKLGLLEPFISENGGGIFIPKDYFGFDFQHDKEEDVYKVIRLGADYKELVKAIEDIRSSGIEIRAFSDMSAREIKDDCGLDIESERLAKMREFDEVFGIDPSDEKRVYDMNEKKGFNHTKGGRYYHIMGSSDKGRAVKIL
mgnify:CR=1 FL=1